MDSKLSDPSDSEDENIRVGFGGRTTFEPDENEEDYDRRSFSSDTESKTSMENGSVQFSNKVNEFKSEHKHKHDDTKSDEDVSSAKRHLDNARLATGSGDKIGRMMANMGYKSGTGLGKTGQGRIEPVEMSTQRGRRGLGLHLPELDSAGQQWDSSLEEIKVKEDMDWLINHHSSVPTKDELRNWLRLGPKKLTIDKELSFCSEEVLKGVLNSKSVFDKLDGNELRRARTRSNPYETIRGAYFLNRAAVKMANIDKACDFEFTEPRCLLPNELLYFADVCAGPGGFSEYVLSKKKWNAKGFGFTLRGENDFKLDEFYAGPCETFHPYYGPKDNGDVYDSQNQKEFYNLIMEETGGKGVHFMMADGGFSVEGQENIQEILSKQLYLCQCLVALMIVKKGGHLVVKLFDLFTHFSAGLVYLMYRCFNRICIFKPNSSRPANSERYLICIGKRSNVTDVIEYLSHVNEHFNSDKNKDDNDILELVSSSELVNEETFKTYLTDSNNILGRKQIIGLIKIAAFCNNPTLTEPTQADMRKQCLTHWGLEIKPRTAPKFEKPQVQVQNLVKNNNLDFLNKPYEELSRTNIESTILAFPLDWYCIPSVSGKNNMFATFYLGLGRSCVYRRENSKWVREPNAPELPPDTLVYAEMAQELRGEGSSQHRTPALHILDAYFLGGIDISHMHLRDRFAEIKKFCAALRKPREQSSTQVRAKNLYSLKNSLKSELYSCLELRKMKSNTNKVDAFAPPLGTNLYESSREKPYYFAVNSILFLKGTAYPWACHRSQRTKRNYYFNGLTRKTFYENDRPPDAVASFDKCFSNRVFWFWPPSDDLTKEGVSKFIEDKCPTT